MKINIFIAVATLAFTLSSCNTSAKSKPEKKEQATAQTKKDNKMKTIEMNETMFNEKVMDLGAATDAWKFKGDKPAIIDFYATWCGPCKATALSLKSLHKSMMARLTYIK